HTGKDGHARQHGAGASAASQASDLDKLARSRSAESINDLLRCNLRVPRESEVLPVDDGRGPCRLPALIEIQPERALRIADAPLDDRRGASSRSVGYRDEGHGATLELDRRRHTDDSCTLQSLRKRTPPPPAREGASDDQQRARQ